MRRKTHRVAPNLHNAVAAKKPTQKSELASRLQLAQLSAGSVTPVAPPSSVADEAEYYPQSARSSTTFQPGTVLVPRPQSARLAGTSQKKAFKALTQKATTQPDETSPAEASAATSCATSSDAPIGATVSSPRQPIAEIAKPAMATLARTAISQSRKFSKQRVSTATATDSGQTTSGENNSGSGDPIAAAKAAFLQRGAADPRFWRSNLESSALQISPLDDRRQTSCRIREELAKAISDSDAKLPITLNQDRDKMIQYKTIMLPVMRAVAKLSDATEALESEASRAFQRMLKYESELRTSQVGSVSHLRAEREGLIKVLVGSIHDMEAEVAELRGFLLEQKLELIAERESVVELEDILAFHKLRMEETAIAHKSELSRVNEANEKAQTEARAREADLRAQLKAEREKVARLIAEGEELERSREELSASLKGQLSDLAKEKEAQEKALRQEAARVEAEGRQRAGELSDQVQKLAMAKAEAEAEFQSNLEAKALKEAALKRRIQTINELQEKALGVESKPHTTGTPRSPNKNAARSRAALYAMSLERNGKRGEMLRQQHQT